MFFYHLSKVRGLRRIIKWFNQTKLYIYKLSEDYRALESPLILNNYEAKTFSQNGEDGILEEIFKRVGLTNKFFIEFGIEDGSENNCRHLLVNKGWSGLWIEGSPDHVKKASNTFKDYPVEIQNEFITKENIVSLIKKSESPLEPDFLTVDIDGNDYYVWEEILKSYKPRVCSIEYNASFTPSLDFSMTYNPENIFKSNRDYGASLKSLTQLGQKYGYDLVGCDSRGVNTFFVRADLTDGKFYRPGQDVDFHYRSPKYHGLFFGFPNI